MGLSVAVRAGICVGALIGFISLNSCSPKGRNWIFTIDVSGSMKDQNRLESVKATLLPLLQRVREGDRVLLVTFDGEVRMKVERSIDSKADRDSLIATVSALEARGSWTHLTAALSEALAESKRFKQDETRAQTSLFLFTDGRNDPPPSQRKSAESFQTLFARHFPAGQVREDWYMYYVSLGELDPELAALLREGRLGETVHMDSIWSLEVLKPDPKTGIMILGGLFFLAFCFVLWVRGRFDQGVLVPVPSAIKARPGQKTAAPLAGLAPLRISQERKKWYHFSSRLDLPQGSAAIGVNLKGQFYLQSYSPMGVIHNGTLLQDRTRLKPGEKIRIGKQEFIFKKAA